NESNLQQQRTRPRSLSPRMRGPLSPARLLPEEARQAPESGEESRQRASCKPSASEAGRIRQWLDTLLAFDCLLTHGSAKAERKYAATLRIVFNPDMPVVRFDDRFTDRQSEAHSLSRELASLDLVKFQKNSFFMRVRNSGPGVGHRYDDPAAVFRGMDTGNDLAIGR